MFYFHVGLYEGEKAHHQFLHCVKPVGESIIKIGLVLWFSPCVPLPLGFTLHFSSSDPSSPLHETLVKI
jgi:hypothetical protein